MAEIERISIIDKDIVFEGSLKGPGQLIINGTLKGRLEGETVVISEEGVLLADAVVGRMTVAGRFEGELRAMEKLVVLATGKCSGKVVCRDLVVAAGGQLNAEVSSISGLDGAASGRPPAAGSGPTGKAPQNDRR
ncbi:MAG: polymer-forming cytoskeletal protein [Desulfobacterales bacterium]